MDNTEVKDYLIKGFAINEKRVKEYQKNLVELQKTIKLIADFNIFLCSGNWKNLILKPSGEMKPITSCSYNFLKKKIWNCLGGKSQLLPICSHYKYHLCSK